VRLVLFHALNPYGMSERRRVNESNVDLNRNFLAPGEAYAGSPAGHAIVSPLLNPDTPYGGGDAFLLRAALAIAQHGFAPLKQATMEGQYDHPKALFFGGQGLERGPALLLDAMRDILAGAELVVQLDVHAGLGKYGGATVLATESLSKDALAETTAALGAPGAAVAPGGGRVRDPRRLRRCGRAASSPTRVSVSSRSRSGRRGRSASSRRCERRTRPRSGAAISPAHARICSARSTRTTNRGDRARSPTDGGSSRVSSECSGDLDGEGCRHKLSAEAT
jgi:hypothetical protein